MIIDDPQIVRHQLDRRRLAGTNAGLSAYTDEQGPRAARPVPDDREVWNPPKLRVTLLRRQPGGVGRIVLDYDATSQLGRNSDRSWRPQTLSDPGD